MTHVLLGWGDAALFVATPVAAMGLPTGPEIVIAYAGALTSDHVDGGAHRLDLVVVIVLAMIGELTDSFLGYGIGRIGVRPLVDRLGP